MIISVKKRKKIIEPQRFSAFHLSRTLPASELIKYIELKHKFTMSKSTFQRLSKKAKDLLSKNKVRVEIVDKKGRPISTNHQNLLKAIEYHKAGFSVRKIEQKTGIAKSTLHYLIKHSKRNKIKFNGSTVFVD